MRFLVRGGGGGVRGGRGCISFLVRFFFGDLSFLDLGGGGRGGLSFLSRSEF